MSGSAERDEDGPAPAPTDEARTKTGLLDELLEVEPRTVEVAPAAGSAAGLGNPLGFRVGRFVEWPVDEAPKVEFDGNTRGPLTARSTIALHRTLVTAAIADGRGVLLCFEDGRPDAPIITGLLQPLVDVGEDETEAETETETVEASLPGEAELETHVDGRRVEIEAADEIVLRCGEASIVLRRNGRVVIRGTYVETRSRGVNRIKGGSVEIN